MRIYIALLVLTLPSLVRATDRSALIIGGNCEERNFANNLLRPMGETAKLLKKFNWEVELQYAGKEARCSLPSSDLACSGKPVPAECCPSGFDPLNERRRGLWSVDVLADLAGTAGDQIPESTVANMYTALDSRIQDPEFEGPEKQFLLVVITHGSESMGKQYICMSDRRMVFPEPELLQRLEALKQKGVKTAVINRSCYSGASVPFFGESTCALALTSGNQEGFLLSDDDPLPTLKWYDEKGRNLGLLDSTPLSLEHLFILSASRSGTSNFNYVSPANYPAISTDSAGNQALANFAARMDTYLQQINHSIETTTPVPSPENMFGDLLADLESPPSPSTEDFIRKLWSHRRETWEESTGVRSKAPSGYPRLEKLRRSGEEIEKLAKQRLGPIVGEIRTSVRTLATGWIVDSSKARLTGRRRWLDSPDGAFVEDVLKEIENTGYEDFQILSSETGEKRLIPVPRVQRATGGFTVLPPRSDEVERAMKQAALWIEVSGSLKKLEGPVERVLSKDRYKELILKHEPTAYLPNFIRIVAKELYGALRRTEVDAWLQARPEVRSDLLTSHHRLLELWRDRDLALHHFADIPLTQLFTEARLFRYLTHVKSPNSEGCATFLLE